MLERDNRLAKTLKMATEVAALIVNNTIGNRKGWISLFSKRPLGREEYQRTIHNSWLCNIHYYSPIEKMGTEEIYKQRLRVEESTSRSKVETHRLV